MNPLAPYTKNGLINIDKTNMAQLKHKYSKKELMVFFNRLELKFPFKEYYIFTEMSAKDRLTVGNNNKVTMEKCDIKNMDIKTTIKKYKTITTVLKNIKLYNYHIISDSYTENCRVKSTIKNELSVWEYFFNKKLREKWLFIDKLEELNTKTLRDSLYYNLHNVELTLFPGIVALTIYKLFNATRILDMSCGWGDRLLAAISYENNLQYYYGIDPNKCLFSGYNKIISLAKNTSKFVMINKPFETVIINKKFDMMFSSPPYFEFEKYSTDTTQSYIKYRSLNSWLKNFMFVSIKKIYNLLDLNGYLCLNISDTGSIPYVSDILQYIEKIGFIFIEVYGYIKYTSCRPIYVFQKRQQMLIK